MADLDQVTLGQLIVEIKALQEQNHRDHSAMQTAMHKDREWSEKRFDELFSKSDNANIKMASLETRQEAMKDWGQITEIKLNKLEKSVPAIEAKVDNLVWFNRLVIGGFILQLIAQIVLAAFK